MFNEYLLFEKTFIFFPGTSMIKNVCYTLFTDTRKNYTFFLPSKDHFHQNFVKCIKHISHRVLYTFFVKTIS